MLSLPFPAFWYVQGWGHAQCSAQSALDSPLPALCQFPVCTSTSFGNCLRPAELLCPQTGSKGAEGAWELLYLSQPQPLAIYLPTQNCEGLALSPSSQDICRGEFHLPENLTFPQIRLRPLPGFFCFPVLLACLSSQCLLSTSCTNHMAGAAILPRNLALDDMPSWIEEKMINMEMVCQKLHRAPSSPTEPSFIEMPSVRRVTPKKRVEIPPQIKPGWGIFLYIQSLCLRREKKS